MIEINLPPFYVGQKVICIRRPDSWEIVSSRNGQTAPNKDDVVTVSEVFNCQCGCGEKMIMLKEHPGIGGFSAECFVPVQENFESISFEKVIEKEKPLTCAN